MKTIWTALPNGVRKNDMTGEWLAHMSAFMTPKLASDATRSVLTDFPAFSDWPKTLREASPDGLHFDIQLTDGTTLTPPTVVRAPQPDLPSSAAWRAIFSPQTPVHAIEPPLMQSASDVSIASYNGKDLAQMIRGVYSETLRKAVTPPETDTARTATPLQDTDPLAPFRPATSMPTKGVGDNGTLHADQRLDTLQQLEDFYRASPEASRNRRTAVSETALDFHQIIAAISTHPQLLRQLGIVIDLEVPLTQLAELTNTTQAKLRIIPRGLPDTIESHSLYTAIEYASAGNDTYRVFCAAKEDRRKTFGFYALGNEGFGISQEQFESTSMALRQHAASPGDNKEMPRLRQSGMRVLDSSIPSKLRNAIVDTAQREAAMSAPPVLGATDDDDSVAVLFEEQLTRGYRIDVRNTDVNVWRSLCARTTTYSADDWHWPEPGQSVDDEGTVEFTMYSDTNGVDARRRTLPDLFEWDGWSLAVPRLPSDDANTDDVPVSINTQVRAGSLQPQRFGDSYEFRARRVDIAGNSLTLPEADALQATLGDQPLTSAAQRCIRVESILPPVVFPAQKPDLQEVGDVLIIRDAESARYRKTVTQAHVFPPATTTEIAERHGMLDGLDADSAWQLLQQHQGRLDQDEQGAPRVMLPPDAAPVPYLPDPLSATAVIRLNGIETSIQAPRFDRRTATTKDNALAHSFLLSVKAGKNELHYERDDERVTLTIPKGRSFTLSLSSKPSEQALKTLAMVDQQWLGLDGDWNRIRSAITDRITNGEAELIAPPRVLRVVHASQRPLIRPVFESPMIATRNPQDSHAVFGDETLILDTPSTGRLDLYAQWQYIDDSNRANRWQTVAQDAHVGGLDIADEDTRPFALPSASKNQRPTLRQEFGDTRHHVVTYTAVAITRFIDLYPDALTDDIANMSRTSASVTLHVPATSAPPPPDVAYVVPTFEHTAHASAPRQWEAEQHGDGLRVYLEHGWFASGVGEQLAIVVAEDASDDEREDVSVWGVDTLRDTKGLPGPLVADYIVSGETVRHEDDAGVVTLRRIHDVQFSVEHQRAFVDVQFVPQVTFMPLVRLVVARFQRHAIAGCQHSTTAVTDFIPLAPGRSVSLRKATASRWDVRMRGAGFATGQDASASSVVQLTIEALSMNTPLDSAAWQPTGATATLNADAIQRYEFEWAGSINVADTRWLTRRWRLRLVVREYELLTNAGVSDAPLADYARLISAHTIAL
ncbi:MAG: hypothetical protein AAF004_12840 [Pseudomonadota bacterium]